MHKPAKNLPWAYFGGAVFLSGGAAFAVTTAIAVIQSYSPVPFWDSWAEIVNFYDRVRVGEWSLWLAPHNEHRPIVPRLFYFAMMSKFGGSNAFLLAINGAFQALTVFVLMWMIRRIEPGAHWRLCLSGVALIFGFSWMQSENFTWEFQTQFLCVFTFAALAFHSLARSAEASSLKWFAAAACSAIAAAFSFGNGVFVIPLLVVQGLLLRIGKRRLIALAMLFFICAAPLIIDREQLALGRKVGDSVDPGVIDRVHAYARMAGAPVYWAWSFSIGKLFDQTDAKRYWIADAAGLVLIAASAGVAAASFGRKDRLPASLALLSLLAFAHSSMAAAAAFRGHFGMDSIMTSRYSTPGCIAILALVILLHDYSKARPFVRGALWTSITVISVALAAIQFDAVRADYSERKLDRNLAALSVKLGVRDEQYQLKVYWDPDFFPVIAQRSIESHSGVFGTPWMQAVDATDIRRRHLDSPKMPGAIVSAQPLETGPYLRVSGWAYPSSSEQAPILICFADDAFNEIGFATAVYPKTWPKGTRPLGPPAYWSGYVLDESAATTLYAVAANGSIYRLDLSE